MASLIRPSWVFDLVFSTGSNLDPTRASYFWAAGAHISAPHVAGMAANIIGMNGGAIDPAAVKLALKHFPDDLGPFGKDAYYGFGRVNAGSAIS